MFHCDGCNKVTKPQEKQVKKVVETREKIYEERDRKGMVSRSRGFETVRAINLGPCCAVEEGV